MENGPLISTNPGSNYPSEQREEQSASEIDQIAYSFEKGINESRNNCFLDD